MKISQQLHVNVFDILYKYSIKKSWNITIDMPRKAKLLYSVVYLHMKMTALALHVNLKYFIFRGRLACL